MHEYGIGNIVWSYNIGLQHDSLPGRQASARPGPTFFDTGEFPGRRTLRDRVNPMLEIALLADGVTLDKLYPLDVDRALQEAGHASRSRRCGGPPTRSRSSCWSTARCSLGIINNGRIYDVVQKGAKIGIEWNQNMQSVDYLVVPRGCKNKDAAMALIDEMTLAEPGEGLANMMPLAPTNPEAFKLIKPEVAPWLSTEPENAPQGFVINEEYWRDNYKDAGRALGGLEALVIETAAERRPAVRRGDRCTRLDDAAAGSSRRRVLLLGVFVYPVAWLLLRELHVDPQLGLAEFRDLLVEAPVYLHALWNTVVISGVGDAAVAAARLSRRLHHGARQRRGCGACSSSSCCIPFWTSLLVRTFAWMVLLQQQGLINRP